MGLGNLLAKTKAQNNLWQSIGLQSEVNEMFQAYSQYIHTLV